MQMMICLIINLSYIHEVDFTIYEMIDEVVHIWWCQFEDQNKINLKINYTN